MKKLITVVLAAALDAMVFANVVITDTEPENKGVSVAANEELEVRGNGLTANCTLSLGAGATVRFYTTATIAAPVTSVGTVHFTTAAADIVGTISGAYTAEADAGANIYADAPGLVSFIGGGTIKSGVASKGTTTKSVLWIDGNLQVSNKAFQVYCAEKFKKGCFTVANGGEWLHQGQSGAQLYMEGDQSGDAVFEIGKGGIVSYGNNEHVQIGKTAYLSKLYINGGTFRATTADRIFLNHYGTGNSVIEIDNGGHLNTARRILAFNSSGTSRMLLKGGDWMGYNSSNTSTSLFAIEESKTGRKVDVVIDGTFTLDLSTFSQNAIADTPDVGKVRTDWTCTPGSTLKLIGRSSKQSVFTLRGFNANGIDLMFMYDSYPLKLVLENAPSAVAFSTYLPMKLGCDISATNTSGGPTPALTVGLSVATATELTQASLSGLFPTFSSVTAGALTFAPAATARSYLAPDVASAASAITNKSGRLILETDSGNVTTLGGTVNVQDGDNPYVLYNKDYWVGRSGATSSWTDHPNSWTTNKVAETEDLISWTRGAVCYLYPARDPAKGDGGFYPVCYASKLLVKPGNCYMDGDNGRIELGSGGMTFVKSGLWGFIKSSSIDRILLCADQTWTNAAETGTAYFTTTGVTDSRYWKARISAKPNVANWKLAGAFETWLSSPENGLTSVAVTVSAPAALRLVKSTDARLNARKLVLDGAEMDFGRSFPVKDSSGNQHVSNVFIDEDHLAKGVELKNGGRLTIAAETTYDLPQLAVTGAGNVLSGTGALKLARPDIDIALADAASELTIAVPFANADGKAIKVSGLGSVTVDVPAAGLATDVVLPDGASLKLTGDGHITGAIANAGALTVAASGTVNLIGSIEGFAGTTIDITAGTLILANKAAIPAGVTVVTSGEGALALIDRTGFSADDMGGTKNLATLDSDLVVTDEPRENETITVGDGETLKIYGNGLKASSSVTLEGGSIILFCGNATVFAPIVSTGTVTFKTLAGVTGTVAGRYMANATGSADIRLDSPGLLNFIGGGTLGNGGVSAGTGTPTQCLKLIGGNVQVTNCTFDVRSSFYVYAGHFTVRDGGTWWVADSTQETASQNRADVFMNQSQTGDACIEVGKGGVFRIYNNNFFYLGGSSTYESKLYVNGGTFRRDQEDWFYMAGKSVLEIDNGGVFATCRELYCNSSSLNGKILLKNGTWSGNDIQSGDHRNQMPNLIAGPSGFVDVTIDGHFTIDLGSFKVGTLTNTVPGRSSWTAKPGSRLDIVGIDGGTRRLVMNAFEGDGLAVSLNAKANTSLLINNAQAETVDLGYVVPGATGCTIQAIGTSPALNLTYVVPDGATFDVSSTPGEFGGFSGVTVSNFVFDAGSTLQFPFFGSSMVTEIPGAVTLPSAMNFRVDARGPRHSVDGAAVLVPAQGFAGGDCSWTCVGGVARKAASLTVENGKLLFSYDQPGSVILVR